MAAKNLNLLNSALVGNAKLLVNGDRIGSGLVTAVDTFTAPLSPEQFPLLQQPERFRRSRQAVPDVKSMPHAVEPNEPPTGSIPGTAACRRAQHETRTELLGTLERSGWSATSRRTSYPGSVMSSHRIGRDCQSPDRDFDKSDLKATMRKQTWHRTAGTTQQAGK